MKYTVLFLALLLGSSAAYAQQLGKDEVAGLLSKQLGTWKISSHFYKPDGDTAFTTTGGASFNQAYKSIYLREQFDLLWKDKSTVHGEAFIRYSEKYKRFELVQVDDVGNSILVLNGTWDPEKKVLAFKPIEGYSQWGSSGTKYLLWDYTFFPDGSFKKEMRLPDEKNNMYLASDYYYSKK
jgi:hypothetical protein